MIKVTERQPSKRFAREPRKFRVFFGKNRNALRTASAMLSREGARARRSSCPLCHGAEAYSVLKSTDIGLPSELLICGNCGLAFAAENFSAKFAKDYYSEIYQRIRWVKDDPQRRFNRRAGPEGYAAPRRDYVRNALGEAYDDIETVAEVGCGDGANLYPYLQEGKTVVGCDFNDLYMNVGRRAGIEIHKGPVDILLEKEIKADLVILSHFIAHVGDLRDLFSKVKRLLAPEGRVYIESPGLKGWGAAPERSNERAGLWLLQRFDRFFPIRVFVLL